MPETSKQEIKLFYCYAREDKSLRDELEKHLSSLKRLYSLRNWHDREIPPGADWEHAINESLDTAHLILLLVSPDFMNSDYCYGKEMQRALERHEKGTCKVIPIILRPTYLPEDAPFHKLQMLPTDAKPITRWPDRDEAFYDVVKGIGIVLKDLLISLKTKKDWLDEGIVYRNQKRYDYALEAFEQAIRRDPNYLEAYEQKGQTLLELARYDYALEAFEQALRIDPKLAPLYIGKGQALDALERYEEALTSFEQAIQFDPNLVDGYVGRDKILRQLGISREAQEGFERHLQKAQQQLAEQLELTKEIESQLEQTRQQKDEVLGQPGIAKEEREQIANQLEQAQQQLADQQEQSKQIESTLEQTRQQLAEQQKRVGQLERQLEQTQQQKDEAIQELGIVEKARKELESFLQETNKLVTSEQKQTGQIESQSQELHQQPTVGQVKPPQIINQSLTSSPHEVSPKRKFNSALSYDFKIFLRDRLSTIQPDFGCIRLNIIGNERRRWTSLITPEGRAVFEGRIGIPNITITIKEKDLLNITTGRTTSDSLRWGVKIDGDRTTGLSILDHLSLRSNKK